MTKKTAEREIQKITRQIVAEFKPEKIILFGSYAWGKPTKDSDLDLFIVKKTNLSTRELAIQIDGSLFPREMPIDLIVYTPDQIKKRQEVGDFFLSDVMNKGKILYEK